MSEPDDIDANAEPVDIDDSGAAIAALAEAAASAPWELGPETRVRVAGAWIRVSEYDGGNAPSKLDTCPRGWGDSTSPIKGWSIRKYDGGTVVVTAFGAAAADAPLGTRRTAKNNNDFASFSWRPPKERFVYQRGDHVEVAERVVRKWLPRGHVWDGSAMRTYFPAMGGWGVVPEAVLRAWIRLEAGQPVFASEEKTTPLRVTRTVESGVLSMIESMSQAQALFRGSKPRRENPFAQAPSALLLPSGKALLLPESGSLGFIVSEADPDLYLRVECALPVNVALDDFGRPQRPKNYDAWIDLLDMWACPVGRDPHETIEVRHALGELVGAGLAGLAPTYQRHLFMLGSDGGANGKSTFIEAVSSIFPAGTVTAVPVHRLGERFGGADIARSLINCPAEVEPGKIADSAQLKSMMTGDRVLIERKHKDPATIVPRALFAVAGNTFFRPSDQTESFRRRWIVVEFPWTIPHERRDPHFRKRIPELQGAVLAWALEGLARAARFGSIAEPASSMRAKDRWQHHNDPTGAHVVPPSITLDNLEN